MNGLMLHAGAQRATIDQVAAVKTPAAEGRFVPTPHIDIIEELERSLARLDIRVANQAHALSANGNRYFGLFDLEAKHDTCTTIGLRNSHDHRFAINGVIGNHVFVCDNLAFYGSAYFNRKNTVNAQRDLPLLIDSTMGKLLEHETSHNQRVETYKNTELTTKDADHLIINALRDMIISVTTVRQLVTEWQTPKHPEFVNAGFTLWRLYNAFTEAMKGSLWNLPKRTIALHNILDNYAIAA